MPCVSDDHEGIRKGRVFQRGRYLQIEIGVALAWFAHEAETVHAPDIAGKDSPSASGVLCTREQVAVVAFAREDVTQ